MNIAADTVKSGVPIRIGRVVKVFGEDTDKPFQALKEVSVDIDAGEFLSVVGPSGCGKSTLMLMVAGLLSRSRGDIAIGGKPVTQPITDVGIAFQDHLLLEFRSARRRLTWARLRSMSLFTLSPVSLLRSTLAGAAARTLRRSCPVAVKTL